MAKDLTIRLLGRPQVTKDDQVGYQRISRQYVVEGYRAGYSGITDATNPLFLAVGTEDEEFEGHYLVNQKISPKQGSVDVAYLTREFVEVRDTWSTENFSQSRGFKKITRQFVVLRAQHTLGYTAAAFNNHPVNTANKEYSPWKYLPTVVADSEPEISELFNIPINIEFNQKWHRSTISVDSKNPGVDVWSVSWTAPIRPEGEPTITKDSQIGFQTVTRSYVITGDYYTKANMFDGLNPLFLDVGTADHEYTDHYLVNQGVKPMLNMQKEGDDTVEDLAILTRQFVEIRDTAFQESVTVANDLRKITRYFVVLRADHAKGYSPTGQTSTWDKHPSQASGYEPWEYAPHPVSEPPTTVARSMPQSTPMNVSALLGEVGINDVINQYSEANSGEWLKGSASVRLSQPGVDVWTVSWATHTNPYWSAGGEKTLGSVNSKSPKTVDFDRDGLKVYSTDAEVRGNLIGQVATISFFVVGEVVTTNLSSNWQGVSNSDPSVCLDFYLIPYDGSKAISFNSVIDNAVFANVGSANLADLATGQGVTNGFRFTGGYYNGDDPSGLPVFKNMRIADGGGTITFTAAAPDSEATTASPITAKTDPIFTSGDPNETKRIWRVRISYAG